MNILWNMHSNITEGESLKHIALFLVKLEVLLCWSGRKYNQDALQSYTDAWLWDAELRRMEGEESSFLVDLSPSVYLV